MIYLQTVTSYLNSLHVISQRTQIDVDLMVSTLKGIHTFRKGQKQSDDQMQSLGY